MSSRSRRSSDKILGAALTLGLLLIAVNFEPTRRIIVLAMSPIRSFTAAPSLQDSAATDLKAQQLQAENDLLKEKLAAAGLEQSNVQGNIRAILAQVETYSPNPYVQEVTIDRGQNDGVSEGSAVLSQGFLVGIVVSADANISRVRLVTDSKFKAIVKTSDGAQGLLKGQYNSSVMEGIPADEDISVDSTIFTSELDEQLPSDLPVGRVVKLLDAGGLTKAAQVASSVQLDRLHVVTVEVTND